MKVIFLTRSDYAINRGGDTIQMLSLKSELEKKDNIEIVICNEIEKLNRHVNADIIHIFNIQNPIEIKHYLDFAKTNNIKIVVSPIYWDLWHSIVVNKIENIFLARCFSKVKNIYKFFMMNFSATGYLSKNYIKIRKDIIESANIILPNSPEEMKHIIDDLNLDYLNIYQKTVVIPNAINFTKCNDSKLDVNDYVLIVGRIEKTKNQLNVIKALYNNKSIPVVIIGKKGNGKKADDYYNKVNNLALKRGNVTFIDSVEHSEIDSYFSNAKVHVLASFRESPGLVTLEALKNSCNVVVSDERYCPIKYYHLDTLANKCNPYSIASIRKAIESAFINNSCVDDDFRSFFSYENAAHMTYIEYEKLLNV